VVVVSHDTVFYQYGRQLELSFGKLSEHRSEPVPPPAQVLPVREPKPGRDILFGWWPRASLPILMRQVFRDLMMRPIFAMMIAIALCAGVTQVGLLVSLIVGAQEYVDVAITKGSRLNRLQIKPLLANRTDMDRFPLASEIASWPNVSHVVPRRQVVAKITNVRGEEISYIAMGLHPDDPEYQLLDFVAGGPFSASNEELETVITVALVSDMFADAAELGSTKTYHDFIGRKIGVLVPEFSADGQVLRTIEVKVTVVGIIFAAEGGRQLYLPNRTALVFDRFKMDRSGAMQMPVNETGDAWTDRAAVAAMADFPWEDQLHIYSSQIREIIPVFRQLSERGFKPDSDIWDFKWVLDIQALAFRVFFPILALIVFTVVLTVVSNIQASAKLLEVELALWRILGMRRGDLVVMQVISTGITVLLGAVAGVAAAWSLIAVARSFLAAENDDTGIEAVFAPVEEFVVPIVLLSMLIGVAAAIWPAQRTARADPARVLQS
jgi:hypothetical protein